MRNDQQQPDQKQKGKLQQTDNQKRDLDDLFKDDSPQADNITLEEEAEAEQQRKEALTERD